jgi:hypothetical protein
MLLSLFGYSGYGYKILPMKYLLALITHSLDVKLELALGNPYVSSSTPWVSNIVSQVEPAAPRSIFPVLQAHQFPPQVIHPSPNQLAHATLQGNSQFNRLLPQLMPHTRTPRRTSSIRPSPNSKNGVPRASNVVRIIHQSGRSALGQR